MPAVTAPRAPCNSRLDALLFLPAAPLEVLRVASKGAGGVVSGSDTDARRHRAKGAVQHAAGRAAFLAGGAAGSDQGGQQGRGRDQTEPLMDLEHMRPFVQSRLILGTTLG